MGWGHRPAAHRELPNLVMLTESLVRVRAQLRGSG